MIFDAVFVTWPLLVTAPVSVFEIENPTTSLPSYNRTSAALPVTVGAWVDLAQPLERHGDALLLSGGVDVWHANLPAVELRPTVVDGAFEVGVRTYGSRPTSSTGGGAYARVAVGYHGSLLVVAPWPTRLEGGLGGHVGLGGAVPQDANEVRVEARLGATLRIDHYSHEYIAHENSHELNFWPGEIGLTLLAGWSPRQS